MGTDPRRWTWWGWVWRVAALSVVVVATSQPGTRRPSLACFGLEDEGQREKVPTHARPDEAPFPSPQAAGSPVELDELRRRLPDNSYWRLDASTADPVVLRARSEEKSRWNVLREKVLSKTASLEEIDRYFEHRQRVADDYLALVRETLAAFGDRLGDDERARYELAARMHRDRLADLQRERAEALAGKARQDTGRRAWEP